MQERLVTGPHIWLRVFCGWKHADYVKAEKFAPNSKQLPDTQLEKRDRMIAFHNIITFRILSHCIILHCAICHTVPYSTMFCRGKHTKAWISNDDDDDDDDDDATK